MSVHTNNIIILDFGSQTTQLIARRIREQKVYSEIHPYTLELDKLKALQPTGIILSGGPASVYDDDAPISDPGILELGVPVLGICYGAQLMMQQMSGRVEQAKKREFGKAELIEDALAVRDCPIPLQQLVRGENIAQVAAASILARAEFVRQIDRLSGELGTTVPRGAGAIVDEAGRKLVSQHGIEILQKIAKVHFKNFARASNLSLLV